MAHPEPVSPFVKRPAHKSAAVADRLEKAILAGKFPVGTRLPSEAELGERFGASRTVIREALKRLNASGIVRTINGSGSYVSDVSVKELQAGIQRYTAMVAPGTAFGELFELRTMLETGAAALAAESPGSEKIGPIAATISEMQRCQDDVPRFADADISFHLAVVSAAGNRLMQAIHAALEPMMRRLAAEMYRDTRKTAGLYEEHLLIFDAIRRGEPAAASDAMRAHLTASRAQWERYTGYGDDYPGAGILK